MIETNPSAEELLWRIQKLEEANRRLKENLRKRPNSGLSLKESEYVKILKAMGRSVYMFDVNNRIVYWNKMSETLYGYTVAEALGKTAPDIIIEPKYSDLATLIIQRAVKGETWSGQFPVRTKYGDTFPVITTLSPCHDENGITFGVMCVCADTRQFRESRPESSVSAPQMISSGLDPNQSVHNTIVSKISTLASKVKLKMKMRDINTDHDSNFAPRSSTGLHKVISLKAEEWMGKKGISLPWLHNDQEQELGPHTSSIASLKLHESPSNNTKEAPGSSLPYSWSIDSNSTNEIDIHTENLDVEISWDDLIIQDQIGQGSRGTVHHALLYGSDVAVKIFSKQEYPYDMILSFRKEVCLMKRLRHPNIVLFMGAVISPLHLCIVTEFLPCGSLFKLLQRKTTKLDWKRRVHMAMDIARGMSYLHHCQPPIIHRDLKSSNLLVDKNWTIKVGEFGLSRIKHATYLTTNTGTGMPHWMAPEVLRDEQVDEKSDVYSYGVVLWEITTGKIPWENLNSMQVIGAVGFMNQRLEIPNDVDPQWASLIESCWSREPQSRPTFQEILIKLKDLQKKFTGQDQGSGRGNSRKKG